MVPKEGEQQPAPDNLPGADLVFRYFPELSGEQRDRIQALGGLYAHWNERVNLISRKDLGHLYERHVLHSLAIAKVFPFPAGSRVVDVGTGGGFPGIPLAILFPESSFHCIDGIGKKIAAVQGVIEALGLRNATAEQVRSTDHRQKYDLVVSRAVTTLPEFIRGTRHLMVKGQGRVLYLKGGDLVDELRPLRVPVQVHEIRNFFKEEFFHTKKVVAVRL